jgi:hypothetical protein
LWDVDKAKMQRAKLLNSFGGDGRNNNFRFLVEKTAPAFLGQWRKCRRDIGGTFYAARCAG